MGLVLPQTDRKIHHRDAESAEAGEGRVPGSRSEPFLRPAGKFTTETQRAQRSEKEGFPDPDPNPLRPAGKFTTDA
jgi:hypothetical protein